MNQDIFDPLFDFKETRLQALGNPLIELEHHINWELFRPLLAKAHEKKRKSNAGAPLKMSL